MKFKAEARSRGGGATDRARVALVLVVAIWLSIPGAALAQERGTAAQFGLGTGAATINMLYGPAKVLYALVGCLTGGLAYLVTGGRKEVALDVMHPALRGDYAVTPDHLVGEKPLRFSGVAPESETY